MCPGKTRFTPTDKACLSDLGLLTGQHHKPALTIMLLSRDQSIKHDDRVHQVYKNEQHRQHEKLKGFGCSTCDKKNERADKQPKVKQAVDNISKIEMMNAGRPENRAQNDGRTNALRAFDNILWSVTGLLCPAMGAKWTQRISLLAAGKAKSEC